MVAEYNSKLIKETNINTSIQINQYKIMIGLKHTVQQYWPNMSTYKLIHKDMHMNIIVHFYIYTE